TTVEVKACGIDLEQQLAAQHDARVRQKDAEQIADGGLWNRDLECRDPERSTPGVQARIDLKDGLLQAEVNAPVGSELVGLRRRRAERKLGRAGGELLDGPVAGQGDRKRRV